MRQGQTITYRRNRTVCVRNRVVSFNGICLAEIDNVIRRVIDGIPSETHLSQTREEKRVRASPAGLTPDHRETRRQFASCTAALKLHDRVDCFDRATRKS